MISYSFQQEGETGLLRFINHFGQDKLITSYKQSHEQFRVSLTAINEISHKQAVVESVWDNFLTIIDQDNQYRQVSYIGNFKSGDPIYVYEIYDINYVVHYMASKELIKNAEILFINIENLVAENIARQLRISTYTGESKSFVL